MRKKIEIIINRIIKFFNKIKDYIDLNNSIKECANLKKNLPKYEKLKIQFGCGPRVLKDWINIDLFFEPFEKYLKYYKDDYYPENTRGNKKDFFSINILKTGLPLEDSSVDLIFHEDFIEHLDQKEQTVFLSETLRVLKVGGVHRINTPDLEKSMSKNSNFNLGKNGVYTEEWDKHAHKNVLTREYLYEIAKMIGYKDVIFQTRNKSISNEIPKEYRPDPNDRDEDGNIFADLIK